MSKKVVFLDRDGTLIVDKVYLNDPQKIEYLPTVCDALILLKKHHYDFVIATNQSGVPQGFVSIENLYDIHRQMIVHFLKYNITFLGFYFAPFLVESNHPLRKPNPGMLLTAAKEHHIQLHQSWMIGDQITDVMAGARAGTKTILLQKRMSHQSSQINPHAIKPTLLEAAKFIVSD